MKRTILVTGSTDGIGKMTATMLAKEGHEVYVHGRNEAKVLATIAEIKEASNNQNIDGFIADLSDLDAVRIMTDEVKSKLSHLDVLLNNAGVFKAPVEFDKKGFDIRYSVNYLAPYVMTKALIPLLEKGEDARIINLSSAAQSNVSFDVMTGKSRVSVNESYAQSKLALTMWNMYLASELENIAVIAVNPGSLLQTKMAIEAYGQFWSSADKGANILFELAVSERHKDITGKYFDNDRGQYGMAHPDAYDQSQIKQLIEFTEEVVKIRR